VYECEMRSVSFKCTVLTLTPLIDNRDDVRVLQIFVIGFHDALADPIASIPNLCSRRHQILRAFQHSSPFNGLPCSRFL
jgi:hypothetical protein